MKNFLILLFLFITTISFGQTFELIEIGKSFTDSEKILIDNGFFKELEVLDKTTYSKDNDKVILENINDTINSVSIRTSKANKWNLLKSNYDDIVKSLTSKYGKPFLAKNEFRNKFKKGNEMQQVLNVDSNFITLFEYKNKKNVVSVEITLYDKEYVSEFAIVEINFSKRKVKKI
jgi:hypothetical protein